MDRILFHSQQYIHQEGLVHSNLKPENFMFDKEGTDDCLVKITDTALFPILDRDLLKTSLNISAQYCGNFQHRDTPYLSVSYYFTGFLVI